MLLTFLLGALDVSIHLITNGTQDEGIEGYTVILRLCKSVTR